VINKKKLGEAVEVDSTLCVRTGHPLRSLKYKRGDKVNLVYSADLKGRDLVLQEYNNSTFIKCYVRNAIDLVVFIHEGEQHVLPLHSIGVVGVTHERL
jgi:hypothetical protein